MVSSRIRTRHLQLLDRVKTTDACIILDTNSADSKSERHVQFQKKNADYSIESYRFEKKIAAENKIALTSARRSQFCLYHLVLILQFS